MSSVILVSGCKKKEEEPIVPAFIVTSINVMLQNDVEGIQFFGKCTNDDVQMTKVILTTPFQTSFTYNLNGNYFIKGEGFDLQEVGTGYVKQTGKWTFIFSGNRTDDGSPFTVEASVPLASDADKRKKKRGAHLERPFFILFYFVLSGNGGTSGSSSGQFPSSIRISSIALFSCSSSPAYSFAGSFSTQTSGSTPTPSIAHLFSLKS